MVEQRLTVIALIVGSISNRVNDFFSFPRSGKTERGARFDYSKSNVSYLGGSWRTKYVDARFFISILIFTRCSVQINFNRVNSVNLCM